MRRRTVTRFGEPSPWTVLVVMCVGYFLVLLDVTIVNVGLPKIGAGLKGSVSSLQWVVDGYAVALASLMLGAGTIGDRHGHKRVVLTGLVLFGAASLACGIAPSVGVLLVARVVQGVGAALLLPGTLAIISHAFQRGGDQARAIGFWAGIGSLALPAGPLLGGALIAAFGWRSIFLVNLPIVLVSGLATVLIVRESRDPQARDLDWVGAALGALFLLATTFAFIEAGRSGAGSPAVVASGLAAVVVLAAFLTFERRKGPDAMLPLALFGRPVFSVANGAAGTMNLCTLGAIFVLTLFLQSVLHYSPLLAGLAALPLFAPLAVLAPLAGRLTSRIGPRLPMGFGFLTAAVGLALLALGGAHSSYLVLLPAFLLWGSGLGLVTPSVVAAAIAAVPRNRAGLASGINNTARQAAGAIGVALAGAIAGKPAAVSSFVTGFHAVALGSACLYALAAIAALALIPGALMPRPWPAGSLPVPRSDD